MEMLQQWSVCKVWALNYDPFHMDAANNTSLIYLRSASWLTYHCNTQVFSTEWFHDGSIMNNSRHWVAPYTWFPYLSKATISQETCMHLSRHLRPVPKHGPSCSENHKECALSSVCGKGNTAPIGNLHVHFCTFLIKQKARVFRQNIGKNFSMVKSGMDCFRDG